MNIYANKGTKVRFIDDKFFGSATDRHFANQYIESNGVYTVERTVVHSWSTDVYLQEVPGVCFNSVLFQEEKTYKKESNEKFWAWAEQEYSGIVTELRQIWKVEMLNKNAQYN